MSAPKERLPKVEYLVRLCKAMSDVGVMEFTLGDFSAKFAPFSQSPTNSLNDPGPAADINALTENARSAVRNAIEASRRANETEEEDTYWSAP